MQFNESLEAVGLIGLGLTGRGIGLRLLKAGHALHLLAHHGRTVADELVHMGAREAASPAELAGRCDSVVLCLPSVDAVRQVLFGPGGISADSRAGLIVIDCSTLLPDAGRDFALRLAGHGIGFVGAPVSRGPGEAAEGHLNAFAGASAGNLERALPVLHAFCERVFNFGDAGSGYAAKLVNNFLAFSQLTALAEAMSTAARAGLAMADLLAAIQISGGQSRVLEGMSPWLTDGSPCRSRVTLETAFKDIAYYNRFAAGLGTQGALARQVRQQLEQGVAAGLADELTPKFVRHVARHLGAELPPAVNPT